ncbi:mitochondrial 39-S ribosomal protein L47 (MRP-L47)-domain-containing protein [Mycena vulgaris]|nr:mitochondrial 39-S ribosomal protein L47 (MRP-L47)-domain-containing protein [Mycena vulgaris]
MLSTVLRAGRRIPPRCLRHFSATPTASASTSSVDPAAPLLLGAPANHRPDTSYAPLAIGSGSSTHETQEPSPEFVPPPVPQLSADHGLYGFFRRQANPNLRGDDQYETFADPTIPASGRAWLASELRLKSFKDLHTLWYVLLRERNLLATQREEMRRMGMRKERITTGVDAAHCRKSMARIKAVINERRLAYEGALALAEEEREEATDAAVLKFQVNTATTEKHRQRAEQLRQRLVEPVRTHRAGVKVQARRTDSNAVPEKKARWTKAQKLANAQHKQRQGEGARGPSQRRVHVA